MFFISYLLNYSFNDEFKTEFNYLTYHHPLEVVMLSHIRKTNISFQGSFLSMCLMSSSLQHRELSSFDSKKEDPIAGSILNQQEGIRLFD